MNAPARRAGHGRSIVVAGLLLAALLVVVGLASRGQLDGDGPAGEHARTSLALGGGVFAYLYAGLLVLGVLAFPFFFYMVVRETPYSKSGRRRARLAPFMLVALVAVGLFVASRWGDDLREAFDRLGFLTDGPDGPEVGSAAQPPAPEWLPLIVVCAVLALSVGGVLLWRATRRRRRPSLAARLSDALDDTLDDVAGEPDPRRAIILAYARMEAALDRSGCSRHEAEAPLEYLARVLGELDVEPAPVETLTELFERAKFSHHAVDAAQKQRAVDALQAIRSELRARP